MVREDDGSFILYHPNKTIEDQMDAEYDRWGSERRWSPKRTGPQYNFFKNKHVNCRAVIIGKGPSLDALRQEDFKPDDIVFCCNDSVHHIISLCLNNQLYSVQLDEGLKNTCHTIHAIHFISEWAKDWVPDAVVLPTNHKKKLLTAIEAILLARHMGIERFALYAFDAMKCESISYANCIGYTPGRNPERFLGHKDYILASLDNCQYEIK